jgi:hypothetical protein
MTPTPSISIPFAVGSTVWHVGAPYRTTRVVCPECAGSKTITVITGTGERYTLKCQHCGPGYRDPTGMVEQRVPDHTPREVRLDRLESIDNGRVSYLSHVHGILCDRDLFATEAECGARCAALRAEQQAEIARYDLATLTHRRDHLAFSVPYWSRQIREMETKLERLRGYLGIAKTKAAEQPTRKKARALPPDAFLPEEK